MCNIGVLRPNASMDRMFLETITSNNSPYATGPFSCLSVMLAYCGQMVGWIKMPLGTEVGLDPDNTVRWGPSSPSRKGAQHSPSNFRLMSIVAKWSHISATAELICYKGYHTGQLLCTRWKPRFNHVKGDLPELGVDFEKFRLTASFTYCKSGSVSCFCTVLCLYFDARSSGAGPSSHAMDICRSCWTIVT